MPTQQDVGRQAGLVKRWQSLSLLLVLLGGALVWLFWPGASVFSHPEKMDYGTHIIKMQKVDRTSDGFRVDLPVGYQEFHLPAYYEDGRTQMVTMLQATPAPETSWSLSWADDPPVTRTVDHSPEHILDLARDNAINRSHTSLISEVRLTINGYPAREFSARNTGGGILNARLIYTGQRMYMLTAAFPAERRSNEKEVAHFFDSLSLINSDRVSESLPPAEIPASR